MLKLFPGNKLDSNSSSSNAVNCTLQSAGKFSLSLWHTLFLCLHIYVCCKSANIAYIKNILIVGLSIMLIIVVGSRNWYVNDAY